MPKQPAFPGFRDAMKKKQTRGVPVRDGGSGPSGSCLHQIGLYPAFVAPVTNGHCTDKNLLP